MNKHPYPNKIEFEELILKIKNLCTKEGVVDIPAFKLLKRRDKYDKTNVFDFIDDEWVDEMYAKTELIMASSWYGGCLLYTSPSPRD